jgi:DNA-directed RNA polymerase beta subunit
MELQRNSFCRLLADGITEEFAKITPLCIENKSFKIILYPEKYQLLLPENSVRDCIFGLKSYVSKLYILAKFLSKTSKQEVLQWVLVGNLPIMTRRGHFLINGSPRVVVHQVVRSPGVYFQQRRGSSKQPRFYADFISRRGTWLRIQTDKRREFLARLKNGKKMEATLLRECFQFMESWQNEENPPREGFPSLWRSRLFHRAFEELFSDFTKGSSVMSKYENEKAYNYLYKRFKNPRSYDLGRIGRRHINKKLKLLVTSDQLTSSDIDATLKHLVSLERGDETVDDIDHLKNRRVRTSGELLQNQLEIGVYRLEKLILTKLNTKLKEIETAVRETLREKSKQSSFTYDKKFYPKQESQISNTNEQELQLDNLYTPSIDTFYGNRSDLVENQKPSYDQMEVKKSIETDSDFSSNPYTKIEIFNAQKTEGFGNQKDGSSPKMTTNIESIGNLEDPMLLQSIRKSRVLSCDKEEITKKTKGIHSSLKSKVSAILKNVINSKPLNSAFREFFGTNPLSHYMDQTNPLAELTHKRRLCSLGLGGVSQDTAGMAVRGIHPSHYGRICPIETPEGKNAGLMNSLGVYTTINSMGFLETPCYRVFKGQVQQGKGLFFLSAQRESDEHFNLAPGDLQLSKTHFLEKMYVPVRATDSFLDEFRKVDSYDVDYMAISPIQMISIATSLIPFLEHDDANRALMGSNMQRQAVPLMIQEKPLIGTGLESLVVAESGHVLQTEMSGFISYVSSQVITVECFRNFSPSHSVHSLISYFTKGFGISYKDKDNNFLVARTPRQPFQWLRQREQSQVLLDCIPSMTFGSQKTVKQDFIRSENLDRLLTQQKDSIQIKESSGLDLIFRDSEQKRDHFLQSYERSNQDTCLTQRALVREGEWVQQGDILADCAASSFGELALGKNILVAYLPWEGYNFEDAIVLNQRLIDEDVYTSIHIERYEIETREKEYGKEQITSYIPGASWKQKRHLTRMGVAQIGSWVSTGDILVGKRTPLEPQPLTPYQKLLYDIMDKAAPREKDTSLRLPKGVHGRVIKHKILEEKSLTLLPRCGVTDKTRKKESHLRSKAIIARNLLSQHNYFQRFAVDGTSEKESSSFGSSDEDEQQYKAHSNLWLANGNHLINSLESVSRTRFIIAASVRSKFVSESHNPSLDKTLSTAISTSSQEKFDIQQISQSGNLRLTINKDGTLRASGNQSKLHQEFEKQRRSTTLPTSVSETNTISFEKQRWSVPHYLVERNEKRGGVGQPILKNVHVYVAEKRRIQIGDKMSGRHGNKGIVSLILPRQDMPYLPDGTPIDILLNPLGVPSRMNVGQVFECLLGLSATKLGQQLKITPFDEIYGAEASKSLVYLKLYQARLKSGQDWLFQIDFPGKTILFDGRSGECFDQCVTVGRAYILKLIHLVTEKIHARATGPYALITQQPLGGRSKNGGQRLGEMEVWALEGFGAAYTLQELLTKKSDDEQGRKQIIETILKIEPSSMKSLVTEGTERSASSTLFTGERSRKRKARLKKLGSPEIFKVLVKELQSLCLGIGIYSLLSHPLKREQVDVL